MITLTPRKDRFAAGVAFAKKIGCRFDPQRKTREQYLLKNGLVIAGGEFDREPYTNSHPGPAQRWMGQASMDHPDSHF
jgi:hypothetical protein